MPPCVLGKDVTGARCWFRPSGGPSAPGRRIRSGRWAGGQPPNGSHLSLRPVRNPPLGGFIVRCCALRGKKWIVHVAVTQTAPQIAWSTHERRYACTHSTQLLYEVGITESLLYIRMHEATHSIPTCVWRKYLCSELARSLRRDMLALGCSMAVRS